MARQAKVPVTEEVAVPYDLHRFIIGQKGRDVRRLMSDHDVNVSIPPADERSNVVRITGAPAAVQAARAALAERVEQLEERVSRSAPSLPHKPPLAHHGGAGGGAGRPGGAP